MNDRQLRLLSTVHAAVHAVDHLKLRAPAVLAAKRDLQAAYERITKAQREQVAPRALRGYTGKQLKRLREDLRIKHLFPIQRRAKLDLKGLPGLSESMRVPHAKAKDTELLAAAKRIADTVRPHEKVFFAAKFAKNFIKQLDRAAASLAAATNHEAAAPIGPGRATADLKNACRDARLALEALDSQIVATLEPRSEQLRLWKKAKRLRGHIGRPRQRPAPRRVDPSSE